MSQDHAITPLSSNGALEVVGHVANEHARRAVFADYLSRKSDATKRTQAAALARFADYLAQISARGGAADLHKEIAGFAEAVTLYPDGPKPEPAAWRGVTWGIVEGFRNWQALEGDAIASLNLRLSVVKTYAKLAMKAGVIDPQEATLIGAVAGYSAKEGKRINERREVTRRGRKKAESTRITREQARALKHQPDTPQGRRDALLMALLLDHGLRAGEVAGLRVGDFDLRAGEMRFNRPKVDKVQTHKLTADALRAARAWFESGEAPIMADEPVLRGSRKGGALTGPGMSERAINNRVRALGVAAGVEGLSPHDCRHFWATTWARKVDPFRLKEAGGWSSIATVDRYVEASKIANEGMA